MSEPASPAGCYPFFDLTLGRLLRNLIVYEF
jgi:hypothetical protein